MSTACAFTALLILAQHPPERVFTYEADVLPAQGGWTLLQNYCDVEEWIEGRWLFHHVQPLCQPEGGQIDYRHPLTELLGGGIEERFFLQWRVHCNGSREEFLAVAPAAISAWGHTGVLYHFTFASDQVRMTRGTFDTNVYIELQPDVPHTNYLALYGEKLYIWYIDGKVVDSGVPTGPYPTLSSDAVNIRAKSWYLESTTRWRHIRMGRIPDQGGSDYNSDGVVDLDDWYFAEECLSAEHHGPDKTVWPGCRFVDTDGDNDADLHDFGLFQLAFSAGD